jgi:hypothetical protein
VEVQVDAADVVRHEQAETDRSGRPARLRRAGGRQPAGLAGVGEVLYAEAVVIATDSA